MLIVNNIIWFVVTGRAVVLVVGGAVDAARCCCCCYCFGSVIVVVVVYRFNIALFLRSFYSSFLNIHRSRVLTGLTWLVPHETAAVSDRVLCTPHNHVT